jgi:phage baseplate assembly protein W
VTALPGGGPTAHVGVPLQPDRSGRTARVDDARHVRDLLEQVLFTAPGERVNRPGFGSGLPQLLFAPADPSVAAAAQLAAQSAVQTWLGDVLALDDLQVSAADAALRVEVTFRLLAGGQTQTVTFTRGTFPPGAPAASAPGGTL